MHKSTIGEITGLLKELRKGDQEVVREQLWSLVYDQLRSMAQRYLRQERQGHTLQPTALVHEAYLRLADRSQMQLEDRSHFFAIAARVMRQILVDHARQKAATKRGSDLVTVQLDEASDIAVDCGSDLVALNDALIRLEDLDPEKASVVELRYFGGLTIKETATALGCSEMTVRRRWSIAKAWLFHQLKELRVGER